MSRIYRPGELEYKLAMQKRNKILIDYYRAAQRSVKAELTQAVDLTDFKRYKIDKAITNINKTIRGLNAKAVDWSKVAIDEAYKGGLRGTRTELARLMDGVKLDFDAPIHRGAVKVLADETALDLVAAGESMKKTTNTWLLKTQQRLIEDKEISRMIAKGVIEGEARRTVSDSIFKEFQKRLKDGQLIEIKGRHYRPDYYAELVARTRSIEAANEAAINMSVKYENDLMQISSHGDACEICQEFQGRVYSISGTHPDFPALTDDVEPPVHPHCRHIMVPVNEDILRERGEYEGLARFSQSQEKTKTFADYERAIAL